MQLRFGLITALSALSFVGCSSMSVNNGSLDYKGTTTTKPLQYPEGAMVRPVTPLYPAPTIEALALEKAPKVENQKGNRFALPRPATFSSTPSTNTTAQEDTVGRPQPVVDGNQNPLLKISGNSSTIWKYTLATLNSLNYAIVNQSKDSYEVTIKVDQNTYVLKLTPLGSSNSLAVFNTDNSFADKQKAADLLAQIYQNWPA